MNCPDTKGVRNVYISFKPCFTRDTDLPEIRNIKHSLSDASENVSFNLSTETTTILTDGSVKVVDRHPTISITVIPVSTIDPIYYSGAAAMDIEIEFMNGSVLSGQGGVLSSSEDMTEERVTLNLTFKTTSFVKSPTGRI